MFKNMSDEKLRKTVTGMIIAGTLIVLTLLIVLVYQLISMLVYSVKIGNIKKEIAAYERQTAELKEDLSYYSSKDFMDYLAQTYGYKAVEDATK